MNINICKNCWIEKNGPKAWNEDDNQRWLLDREYICIYSDFPKKIDKDPIDDCKYKLEHLILNQGENEQ